MLVSVISDMRFTQNHAIVPAASGIAGMAALPSVTPCRVHGDPPRRPRPESLAPYLIERVTCYQIKAYLCIHDKNARAGAIP